jgi:hypothetical protein
VTNWTEMQKLLASDGTTNDFFGWSISLSGNTTLVGAMRDNDNGNVSGSAYVFTRTGSTWTQQQKLLASDGATDDRFGYSVSVDGDTALIGAYFDDDNGVNSGSAYVFTRTGTTWTQQAKLLASDGVAEAQFGNSVSLSGDTALVGAMRGNNNGNVSGSAYVFTRTGTTWTQQAKLFASDGAPWDFFGYFVSLDGNNALIGVKWDDDNGVNSGSAYVFTRTGTTWTQQQKLLASDGVVNGLFGWSVSLSGDTALIGAYEQGDNGVNYGAAYVFIKENKNLPPVFGTPTPINDSTNNSLSFNWSIPISDPEGNQYSWTIQCNNGQTISGTRSSNATKSLSFHYLLFLTTYKVWVNATDPIGSGLYTRKWYTFTTKANQPPHPPTIDGPASGNAGVLYTYNFVAVDPEGDDVFYRIIWGDGSPAIEWFGPYHSGQVIIVNYAFSKTGTFIIQCQAKDSNNASSDWGQLKVTMPKVTPYIPMFLKQIERLIERFSHALTILKQLLGC